MQKFTDFRQPVKFGALDYWMMFKARGIRLPLAYFFQAHLFDLRYGTDTHSWMPKNFYEHQPENFEHGVLYMCSWTSEIRRAFYVLQQILGPAFEEYTFIDIGCGKGKVALSWALLREKNNLKQRIVGVDYYKPFIKTASLNQHAMGLFDDIVFMHGDATETDYASFGKKLITYLYNPFNEIILRKMLARLDAAEPLVIYNNPVHANEVCSAGYEIIWNKTGWHPNAHTMILRKKKTGN